MTTSVEAAVREHMAKHYPNSTMNIKFWSEEELRNELAKCEAKAAELGCTYQQLEDWDWDGSITGEEFNLFRQWKKIRRMLAP